MRLLVALALVCLACWLAFASYPPEYSVPFCQDARWHSFCLNSLTPC